MHRRASLLAMQPATFTAKLVDNKTLFCHSEQSEESHISLFQRSFPAVRMTIGVYYSLYITRYCHVERAQRRDISKISRYKRSLTCVRDDTAEDVTHYTLHNHITHYTIFIMPNSSQHHLFPQFSSKNPFLFG